MARTCRDADCKYDPTHVHGPQCTSTCGECFQEEEVVDAEIIPVKPQSIEWRGISRGWRFELQPGADWAIVIIPGSSMLGPEEVRRLQTALSSAEYYAERNRHNHAD